MELESHQTVRAVQKKLGWNVWQHEQPIEMSKAIHDVQLRNKNVYDALKRLEKRD